MLDTITVRKRPSGLIHEGLILYSGKSYPCCLGRSGITTNKREGDGATPAGRFGLLYAFFRAERVSKPRTPLPLSTIKKEYGWCDDPRDPNYNSLISLPFSGSHEIMTRHDRLYDICIVLDYNIHPRVQNRGSAIFFHQTSTVRGPTEGCVAIDPELMRLLLPRLSRNTEITIEV